MVGWHHQHNGHEFEQTLGDSEGQGSLACSPWVTESDTAVTEQRHQQQAEFSLMLKSWLFEMPEPACNVDSLLVHFGEWALRPFSKVDLCP